MVHAGTPRGLPAPYAALREVLPRRLRSKGLHAAGIGESQRTTREVRLPRANARARAPTGALGPAPDGDLICAASAGRPGGCNSALVSWCTDVPFGRAPGVPLNLAPQGGRLRMRTDLLANWYTGVQACKSRSLLACCIITRRLRSAINYSASSRIAMRTNALLLEPLRPLLR